MKFRIEYYTIKQYSGVLTFDNVADFEAEVALMRLDSSIVRMRAYRGDRLECTVHNANAVPRTKSSPVEKGHIN